MFFPSAERLAATPPPSGVRTIVNFLIFLLSPALGLSLLIPSAMAGNPVPVPTTTNPIENTLVDGTYLYGQSTDPKVIGQEYLVFKVKQGQLQGAFYMPQSEFACVTGEVQPQQLSLQVFDPYGEEPPSPITIAWQMTGTLASQAPVTRLKLDGFEAIAHLSAADTEILQQCLQ